ncbi:MAG: hypothetical protein M1155_00155 [Patescibacteria group bacterium]|nr:hypothetical protein [Patescibacteria group bacterium]
MNEELIKKITEIKQDGLVANEKIADDLIKQGYKKEDIQEILNKELWKNEKKIKPLKP